MKLIRNIALTTAALAVLAVLAQPAFAVCGNSYLVSGTDKSIHSNPAWCGDGAAYCYSGNASPGNEAPLSTNFTGVFWSMGTGNPAIGPGDDNGTFGPDEWIDNYALPSIGYYRARLIIGGSNWGQTATIDGCVDNQGTPGFDGGECTCMALFDQWNGQGYFALLSDKADAGANYEFADWIPGDLNLAPIPAPVIVNSVRAGTNVDLTVSASTGAGQYFDPACGGCNTIKYKIYQVIVPRNSAAPTDRSIGTGGWTLAPLTAGGAQPGVNLGNNVQVRSACGASNTDVYLGAQLVFDSGFATNVVSSNATKVECGPQIADPVDLDTLKPRPSREKPGKPVIPRPTRDR